MPRRRSASAHDELDLRSLRALTHPLRLRLLELLDEGPSTASRLAHRLAESSGATSYHLRALARFGFVEEVPELGTARERWWRRTGRRVVASAGTRETPAYRAAYTRLRADVLERDARVLADFLANEAAYPPVWREAAVFLGSTLHATPEELERLGHDIGDLLRPLLRPNRTDLPENARRVHVSVRALPWWR